MEYRVLGATGIRVSTALPRHDDVRGVGQHRRRRMHPGRPRARSTAASTSSTPPTSIRTGDSEDDRRSSARRPAGRCRPGDEVPQPDGSWTERTRELPALDHAGRRGEPAAAGHRPHRPLPGASPRGGDRDRGDALGPDRPAARRHDRAFGCSTFPAGRSCEAQWAAERRGLERFRTEQPPYSILARHAEARRAPRRPGVPDGGARLGATRPGMAHRALPAGGFDRSPTPERADRASAGGPVAAQFDLERERDPSQARHRRAPRADRRAGRHARWPTWPSPSCSPTRR